MPQTIALDKNRLCDEVGERLKQCDPRVIATIAEAVFEEVTEDPTNAKASTIKVEYLGNEQFAVKRE